MITKYKRSRRTCPTEPKKPNLDSNGNIYGGPLQTVPHSFLGSSLTSANVITISSHCSVVSVISRDVVVERRTRKLTEGSQTHGTRCCLRGVGIPRILY